MTRTYPYNKTTLKYVFDQLMNFKNQGSPKEYEVRIDNLTVVTRTNNVTNFHLFKRSLNEFSQSIAFLFYKGKSRKYDKYELYLRHQQGTSSSIATKEYIEQEVKKRLEEQNKEMKWSSVKEKNKHLKKEVKRLKSRNAELEAKQSNDIKEVIALIASQLPGQNKDNPTPKGDLNGIALTDVIQMINERRKQWGDDVFMRALGIAMTLGDDIGLLEATEELIRTKGNNQ